MKTLKKYNKFINEDLEDIKDDIATNLEEFEKDDNVDDIEDIKNDVDKQVELINKKKVLIDNKLKLLIDQIALIDNDDDKKIVQQNIDKLKKDLTNFDETIQRLSDQKKTIEDN